MGDLDHDELIATRKLHGLNDGLFRESDKNVANDEIDLTTVYMKGFADAEKKYRARIKELEDYLYSTNCIIADLKDSIPVQKVIDKMGKLNKEIKNYDGIEAIFKIKQQQILQDLLEEK